MVKTLFPLKGARVLSLFGEDPTCLEAQPKISKFKWLVLYKKKNQMIRAPLNDCLATGCYIMFFNYDEKILSSSSSHKFLMFAEPLLRLMFLQFSLKQVSKD